MNWNSGVVEVKMTPVGIPAGRNPKKFVSESKYGKSDESVILGEIAKTVGGPVLYIGIDAGTGIVFPVYEYANPSRSGQMSTVGHIIALALNKGYRIFCFGSDRAKWNLEFEFLTDEGTTDAIDNDTDRAVGLMAESVSPQVIEVEPNGIRRTF